MSTSLGPGSPRTSRPAARARDDEAEQHEHVDRHRRHDRPCRTPRWRRSASWRRAATGRRRGGRSVTCRCHAFAPTGWQGRAAPRQAEQKGACTCPMFRRASSAVRRSRCRGSPSSTPSCGMRPAACRAGPGFAGAAARHLLILVPAALYVSLGGMPLQREMAGAPKPPPAQERERREGRARGHRGPRAAAAGAEDSRGAAPGHCGASTTASAARPRGPARSGARTQGRETGG